MCSAPGAERHCQTKSRWLWPTARYFYNSISIIGCQLWSQDLKKGAMAMKFFATCAGLWQRADWVHPAGWTLPWASYRAAQMSQVLLCSLWSQSKHWGQLSPVTWGGIQVCTKCSPTVLVLLFPHHLISSVVKKSGHFTPSDRKRTRGNVFKWRDEIWFIYQKKYFT